MTTSNSVPRQTRRFASERWIQPRHLSPDSRTCSRRQRYCWRDPTSLTNEKTSISCNGRSSGVKMPWIRRAESLPMIATVLALSQTKGIRVSTSMPQTGTYSGKGDDTERVNDRGCGVDRWANTTATDAGVGTVHLGIVTQTTFGYLTSLKAPRHPSNRFRSQPTGATVRSVTATPIRYRLEPDADYHLVRRESRSSR
jgi:hypothetical protein